MKKEPSRATLSGVPGRVAAEQRHDDLKQIRGIGPAAERRLHKVGIRTFAHLANLSPDRLGALSAGLSAKRIARENWIGQARRLARNRTPRKTSTGRSRKSSLPRIVRQHYATFTVELLLDESNDVRRTHCEHIQSAEQDSWAGWNEPRMLSFLVKQAGLSVPSVPAPSFPTQPKAALPTTVIAEPILPLIPDGGQGLIQTPVVATINEQGALQETQPIQAEPLRPHDAQGNLELGFRPGMGELRGGLRLLALATMSFDNDEPRETFPAGKPLRFRLSLDLANVTGPLNVPLECTVNIYGKRLGGGPRQIIGEVNAAVNLDDRITFEVPGKVSLPGLYRLEALVRLSQAPLNPQTPRGLIAMLKGSLLQIY